jgi:hypothetical protein
VPRHVLAFKTAARGVGAIPWHSPDLALTEEDQIHTLLNPPDGSRGLSLAAARILARQLRSTVERHADRMVQAAGCSTACSFDLLALIPVPPAVLQCGSDDAASHVWLRRLLDFFNEENTKRYQISDLILKRYNLAP